MNSLDVVVARRPDLRPELVRAQARDGLHARDRRARVRHDGLVDEVVRVRERDVLRPLRRVRDLRHVEVERLLAGPERVVERHRAPCDLALREAELLRDRVGDRRLVALPARRVRPCHGFFAAPPHHGGNAGLSVARLSWPSLTRLRLAFAQPGIAAGADGPPVAVAARPRARTLRPTARTPTRIADPLLVRVAGAASVAPCVWIPCAHGEPVHRARGGGARRQADEPGQGALPESAARRSATWPSTTSRSERASSGRCTSGRRSFAASRTASPARRSTRSACPRSARSGSRPRA